MFSGENNSFEGNYSPGSMPGALGTGGEWLPVSQRRDQGGVWGLEASLDVSPRSLDFRFSTASTLKSLKSE